MHLKKSKTRQVIVLKPVKLEMTAFGPYPGRETVDFRKLGNRNIFLITGPTGSGKTTIFDAISYAIYGEASGDGRDGENLRSQFADPDVLTSVQLYFELKGRAYSVKRIPRQMKPKLRGEGFTEQKSDAELKVFCENGDYKLTCGIVDVKKKIDDIMGISYEQFKQIIMIPQGEFRQLLVSDSREKEKILRKIFNTQIYGKLESALSDTAGSILGDIKLLDNKRAENISKIQCENDSMLYSEIVKQDKNFDKIVSLLQNEISSDMELKDKLDKKVSDFYSKIENIQKQIYEAQQNNKKVKEKIKVQEQIRLLKNKADYIKKRENKLSLGRKAFNLEAIEKNYLSRNEDVNLKKRQLEKCLENVKEAEIGLKQAEEILSREEKNSEYRNSVVEKISNLKGVRSKLIDFKEQSRIFDVSNTEFQKLKFEWKNKDSCIKTLKKDIDISREKIDHCRNFEEESVKLKTKHERLDRIYFLLEELENENQSIIKMRDSYKKYSCEVKQEKTFLNEQKQKLNQMEDMFLKSQASFFAGMLSEGEPCPVCGSTEHPSPTVISKNCSYENSIEVQRKLINELEKKFDKANEKFNKICSRGMEKKIFIERIKKEYRELSGEGMPDAEGVELSQIVKDKKLSLKDSLTSVEKDIKSIEKDQKNFQSQKDDFARKSNLYENEMILFQELNDKYSNYVIKIESMRGKLEQIRKDIPEQFGSVKKLENDIKKLEFDYEEAAKSFKRAQNSYVEYKSAYNTMCSSRISLEKDVEIMKRKLDEAHGIFKDGISNFGFKNLENYKNAKISTDEENDLDLEISSYYAEVKSAEDRFCKLLSEIKNEDLIDTDELESKIVVLKYDRSNFENKRSSLTAKIKINKSISSRVNELFSLIYEKEKKYSIVGELSRVCKGANRERINFERYVLSSFFEDIIEAANIRFRKMSGGRYELGRITETGKGRAQAGLDLQVYDNYTGKFRHVKTLSGGESFKAALSLSLGLADIVQSYSGGISLDTMFIDEGFGTLDSESLDSAIQCLVDLQSSGRLVGIISHVPELRERIDAKLEIIPGTEGSKTSFNIV